MNAISRLALAAIAAAMLTGCAVQVTEWDTARIADDQPAVGVVQSAELGERMLYQQNVEVVRGRKVDGVQRGSLGPFPMDMSGMYVRSKDRAHYCGTLVNRDPLNFGKTQVVCLTDQEFRAMGVSFTEGEEIIQKPTNLQRILEYAGRDGKTLSVFYKEYTETVSGAFIRPAFTQEFKFDLSEGNQIGVKGARIEVIEAKNTGITYKVLAHFPR